MRTYASLLPLPPATSPTRAPQVHSYLQLPGGRTGYLSELRSGAEVLVAGADGSTRSALVGRVKIEARPLVSGWTTGVCGWVARRGW